jgi:hypothetical protein
MKENYEFLEYMSNKMLQSFCGSRTQTYLKNEIRVVPEIEQEKVNYLPQKARDCQNSTT